jgi:hypothetical protein
MFHKWLSSGKYKVYYFNGESGDWQNIILCILDWRLSVVGSGRRSCVGWFWKMWCRQMNLYQWNNGKKPVRAWPSCQRQEHTAFSRAPKEFLKPAKMASGGGKEKLNSVLLVNKKYPESKHICCLLNSLQISIIRKSNLLMRKELWPICFFAKFGALLPTLQEHACWLYF